ncbi:hypothetical protein K466DRAFT_413135 [Polyporus arcularius HHB13444]|uniref:Uncharacterized protein n=1 Tax=Polyporus arcularius HHB13444 TaxID=1314778 RepID=A0A5C3PKV9_9APHY|nr:hypothetical protein K466DRAFT_413135 [Polyporus arcularius HHB13444]
MPAVLSTARLGNHSDRQCRKCDRDVPPTPRHWDYQLRMCRVCALTYIPPIRIPGGRAQLKKCVLCNNMLALSSFTSGADKPPHDRCRSCRKRERCTSCRKIKKRKEFQRTTKDTEGRVTGTRTTKTCRKCLDKKATREAGRHLHAVQNGEWSHLHSCYPVTNRRIR